MKKAAHNKDLHFDWVNHLVDWALTATHPQATIFIITVFISSPLLLMVYFGIERAYVHQTQMAYSEKKSQRDYVALHVEEKIVEYIRMTGLLVTPELLSLVETNKWTQAINTLAPHLNGFSFIDRAILLTPEGIAKSNFPTDESVLNVDRSSYGWYKEFSIKKKSFISEIYTRAGRPQKRVVSIIHPLELNSKTIGILNLQIDVEQLFSSSKLKPADEIKATLLIIDQKLNVLYDEKHSVADHFVHNQSDPIIQRLFEHKTGVEIVSANWSTMNLLTGYAYIEQFGWGIAVIETVENSFNERSDRIQRLIITYAIAFIMFFALLYSMLTVILRKKIENSTVKQESASLKIVYEKLSHLFGAVELMCITDSKGYFINVNELWYRTLGYTENEIIQKHFFEFIHPDDKAPSQKATAPLLSGGHVLGYVNRYRCQSGNYKWIEWYATYHEEKIYVVGRDITQSRTLESELKHTKDIAENSNQIKSQMISHISHEVRNPLNAIIGFAELALNSTDTTTRYHSYTQHIHSSALQLLSLINDVLDLSRLESGRIVSERTPFDLESTLKTISNHFSSLLSTKNLTLVINVNPNIPRQLKGDHIHLNQILMNLISNAIKFSDHGAIQIEVSFAELTPAKIMLEFQIIDNGIGMTPELIDKIFIPFNQISRDTTKKYGGTGLGLSICKNLISLLGGEITVISQIKVGSKFTIKLPIDIYFATQQPNWSWTTLSVPDASSDQNILATENTAAKITVQQDTTETLSESQKDSQTLPELILQLQDDLSKRKFSSRKVSKKILDLITEERSKTEFLIIHQHIDALKYDLASQELDGFIRKTL